MPKNYSRAPGPLDQPLISIEECEIAQLPAVTAPEIIVEGAMVNLIYRAAELGLALKALNLANSSLGVQKADGTPHRVAIQERYGRDTDRVIGGARKSESRHVETSKRHFARAAGLYSMIAAGTPGDEAAALVGRMYRTEFEPEFGVGVSNGKIRNAKAKSLMRNAKKAAENRKNQL